MSSAERLPWQRVWDEVNERRLDLRWSLARLYVETVSEGTYNAMKKSGTPIKKEDKRRRVCGGIGWITDSIDRILAGRPPAIDPGWTPPADPDEIVMLGTRIASLEHRFTRLEALVDALLARHDL